MKNNLLLTIVFSLIVIGTVALFWLDTEQKKEDLQSEYYYVTYKGFKFLNPTDTLRLNRRFQLLLFFSSTCDLCQLETETLKDFPYQMGDVDIFWLSKEEPNAINQFVKENELLNRENVHIVQIDSTIVAKRFKIEGFPSYILYEDGEMYRRGKGIFNENLLWDRIDKLEKESNENN